MVAICRLLLAIAFIAVSGCAFAQSVPNGGSIPSGLIWTPAQWMNAWQSKADVTNGTLNNPTITGSIIGGINLPRSVILSGAQGGDAAHSAFFSQAGWSGSTTLAKLPLNQISASMNVSAPNTNAITWLSNQSIGSFSAGAQFTGIQSQITQTASTNSKTAGAPQTVFAPFQAFASVSHTEGGTGTAAGQSYGTLVGLDSNMGLSAGATNFYAIQGLQLGASIASSASASHRAGIQIYSGGAAQGALSDAGIDISGTNSPDPGFMCGLCFGMTDATVWPVSPTGTMIGTYSMISGGAQSAAYGLDFSAITFSSAFLKSTGFLVDGSGNIKVAEAGFNGTSPIAKPTVTGSRSDGTALASLLTALANYGLITNSTTP